MKKNTDTVIQTDDDNTNMKSEGPGSKSNYDRFNRSIKAT